MFQFDLSDISNKAKEYLFGIFIPHEKFFVLYLATSFGLAWFVWWVEMRKENKTARNVKDFFSYIFNSSIYNHKSSWQDYWIVLINGIVYYVIISQFVLSQEGVSGVVHQTLLATFGQPDHPIFKSITGIIFLTIVIALLLDLSIYCAHYMLHKIPMLWAFHKVHHSAEVMTPVTVLRLHPVELLLNAVIYAVFVGFGIGLFSYLTTENVTEACVLGLNTIVFVFYLTGIHLRHSHVWLHYPSWLTWLLISPAQHQIHHSTAIKHFDRNLGFIFSFWDKMFGTLYVPKEKEQIEFGIRQQERNPYVSVKDMYLQPFREMRK